MKQNPLLILDTIAQIIFDKKGRNILALDVRGISSMADFILIAEGSVDRHVKAIAQAIITGLKESGENAAHVEGRREGDWVVLDYQQIVIHLFMPGLRDRYQLEELWREGKIVDLKIDVETKEEGFF